MEFKPIKTLDVEVTKKILAAYQGPDLIKEEVERENSFLKNQTCLKCGSKALFKTPQMQWVEEEGVQVQKPIFGDILPKNYLKCKGCDCEFDPYTRLIVGLT